MLSSQTFTEEDLTGGDAYGLNSVLNDSLIGPVWDLQNEQSLVHPNCRCYLDVEIDLNPSELKINEEEGIMVTVSEAKEMITGFKNELKDMSMNYHQLREIEMVFNRFLLMIERSTGDKEIAAAINKLQMFMTFVRMAQISWVTFTTATGPLGWLAGASSIFMMLGTANMMTEAQGY